MKSEEYNKQIGLQEFYEKYCTVNGKPVILTDKDKHMFELYQKALKENKDVIYFIGKGGTYIGLI